MCSRQRRSTFRTDRARGRALFLLLVSFNSPSTKANSDRRMPVSQPTFFHFNATNSEALNAVTASTSARLGPAISPYNTWPRIIELFSPVGTRPDNADANLKTCSIFQGRSNEPASLSKSNYSVCRGATRSRCERCSQVPRSLCPSARQLSFDRSVWQSQNSIRLKDRETHQDTQLKCSPQSGRQP